MRVLFLGTPQFSADILAQLLAQPELTIVGVVTQHDEAVGRKKTLTPPPTKTLAMQHRIPVFQPTILKDEAFLAELDALHADVAVIVAFGRILPRALLARIPLGFINLHPSLLPKYRGPSPMQAALLHGDEVTGVTIMKIDAGMDTGPILAQHTIDLSPTDTTTSLTTKVVAIGGPLLIDSLIAYTNGSLVPVPQEGEASLCGLLTRHDGVIDWNTSATHIDRMIRAFTPWPSASTTWIIDTAPLLIKIFSATPVALVRGGALGVPYVANGQLCVNAGDASTLLVHELQPAGGKRMTADAFIRGYMKNASLNDSATLV